MARLVIDASVLVSAAVAHPESSPTRLLEAVRAREVEMVTCEPLLGEVERALAGRYFTRRVTAEERIAYLALIRAIGAARPDPSPATATFSNTPGCNHPRSRFVTPASTRHRRLSTPGRVARVAMRDRLADRA